MSWLSPQVHVREVDRDEERLVGLHPALDEVLCARCDVVVDGLHAFASERARVFAHLLADLAKTGPTVGSSLVLALQSITPRRPLATDLVHSRGGASSSG